MALIFSMMQEASLSTEIGRKFLEENNDDLLDSYCRYGRKIHPWKRLRILRLCHLNLPCYVK